MGVRVTDPPGVHLGRWIVGTACRMGPPIRRRRTPTPQADEVRARRDRRCQSGILVGARPLLPTYPAPQPAHPVHSRRPSSPVLLKAVQPPSARSARGVGGSLPGRLFGAVTPREVDARKVLEDPAGQEVGSNDAVTLSEVHPVHSTPEVPPEYSVPLPVVAGVRSNPGCPPRSPPLAL